jgi:hypothetical protein
LSDYWTRPYPRKVYPGTPGSHVDTPGVFPAVSPPSVVGGVPVAPTEKTPAVLTPPATPRVQAPFIDSWPEAPKGTRYTVMGCDMHGAAVLPPGQNGHCRIAPDMNFKPMFLWCRPMRDVFLTDYKIGNRSLMNSWGEIATTVFRRFVPWSGDIAQVGNQLNFQFQNRHKTRSYLPEVVILGLVSIEPVRPWHP